jgi:hypothetical protein
MALSLLSFLQTAFGDGYDNVRALQKITNDSADYRDH